MRKLIILGVFMATLALGGVAAAAPVDYGPPPHAPDVTCTTISVDPPSVSYVQVTFTGTIGGIQFSKTVAYGAPTPHIAIVDDQDLTDHSGPLPYTVWSTWNIGTGKSEVATGTLHCFDPPPDPTTTTTAAKRNYPPTTGSTTSTTTASTSTVLPARLGALPRTGGSSGRTALIGSACGLAGLGALGLSRRRAR